MGPQEEEHVVTRSQAASKSIVSITTSTRYLSLEDSSEPRRKSPLANSTSRTAHTPVPTAASSAGLKPLLRRCQHKEILDFESFVATFVFDDIHGAEAGNVKFMKIGEASFSEVFSVGQVVLKVIPLVLPDGSSRSGELDVELPCASTVSDVVNELIVTKLAGESHEGFIKLLR